MRQLGVKISVDHVIGRIKTVDELLAAGYHAVFIGTGAGLPAFLGIRDHRGESVRCILGQRKSNTI